MPLFGGPPNVEKMEAERNVKGLIKALDYGKDAAVRKKAAEALVNIGAEAVGPLIATLKDYKGFRFSLPALPTEALLVKIGDGAVKPLIAALNDSYAFHPYADAPSYAVYPVRERAIRVLGQIGETAVEPLIAALKHSDDYVCENAVKTLGQIGDARAVEPLIAALQDSHSYSDREHVGGGLVLATAHYPVRKAAAEALGQIGDARAVKPLTAALNDRDEYVRKGAAEALGEIGGAQAIKALTAAAADYRYETTRMTAARALEKLGNKKEG